MAANAYAVLEVPEDASVQVIRKTQRRLVFACHEGMHGREREGRLRRITLAADELIDPFRRGALDDNIAREREKAAATPAALVPTEPANSWGSVLTDVAGFALK